MRVAASRGIGGLGDPFFEAARRWRLCAAVGLPVASWHLRGLDATDLEDLLSDAGQRGEDAITRDPDVMKILRAASYTTTPEEIRAQLLELAAQRDPAPLPPVTVDRTDPLADVALGCSLGVEAHAVDLLGRREVRDLLEVAQARVPRAYWTKLASVRVSVDLARAQLVELLVDLAVLPVEAAERARLEEPAREAAARVQAAAAAARARILEEIGS